MMRRTLDIRQPQLRASMKVLDRAFAAAIGAFFFGAFMGAILVLFLPIFHDVTVEIFQARMLGPLRAVSAFGKVAVLLLIFVNNSIPALLSFLYPLVIAKVQWAPPLTAWRRRVYVSS